MAEIVKLKAGAREVFQRFVALKSRFQISCEVVESTAGYSRLSRHLIEPFNISLPSLRAPLEKLGDDLARFARLEGSALTLVLVQQRLRSITASPAPSTTAATHPTPRKPNPPADLPPILPLASYRSHPAQEQRIRLGMQMDRCGPR